jgi:hypothetical protein
MEGEAACSVPRAVVDVESLAKDLSTGRAEHRPRGDDGADPATANKKVGLEQVLDPSGVRS